MKIQKDVKKSGYNAEEAEAIILRGKHLEEMLEHPGWKCLQFEINKRIHYLKDITHIPDSGNNELMVKFRQTKTKLDVYHEIQVIISKLINMGKQYEKIKGDKNDGKEK